MMEKEILGNLNANGEVQMSLKKHVPTCRMHSYCVAVKLIWPLFISRLVIKRKLLLCFYNILLCIVYYKKIKKQDTFCQLVSFRYMIYGRDAQSRPV